MYKIGIIKRTMSPSLETGSEQREDSAVIIRLTGEILVAERVPNCPSLIKTLESGVFFTVSLSLQTRHFLGYTFYI